MIQAASVISFCNRPAPGPSELDKAPSVANQHSSVNSLSSKLRQVARSRTPSHEPTLMPIVPGAPRRMVLVVVGLKPHRGLWATSARPGESVIRYQLLSDCPAVVLPAKTGAPLLSWYTERLGDLWSRGDEGRTVAVLMEYLELCVDWTAVEGRVAVQDAVRKVVCAAMESRSVGTSFDHDRSGVAMWRIP